MKTIINKIKNNQRVSYDEAVKLYDKDLLELGILANQIREERFGKKTYYNVNRHINPTNICKDVCQFCAYSASRKNPNQYTMTHEQILQIVQQSVGNGIKEVHIVSAHNPNTGLDW